MSRASKLLRVTPGRLRSNPAWTSDAFFKNASLEPGSNFKQLKSTFHKWIYDREQEGYLFSTCARQHKVLEGYSWQSQLPPDPRVVGLVVDTQATDPRNKGFVNPLLTTRSSSGWRVTKNYLPFHPEQIQDALFQVLQASGLSLNNLVPEIIGFSIREELNVWTNGDSMIVAGLLSVIDTMNGNKSELFSKACAVVMPQDDRLVKVESLDVKLAAFAREYGKASLLVAPINFQVPEELKRCFPESVVWRVGSYQDLADKLVIEGQLSSFGKEFPLDIAGLNEARNRLKWLKETGGNAAALQFSERLDRAANLQSETSLRISQGIEHDLRELNRHVGRFAKAISHSESAVQKLEKMGTRISSFEEIVIAKTQLAASLFDGHDFEAGISMLNAVVSTVTREPSFVKAEVEIELRNTLGRLGVIAGKQGSSDWQNQFDCSIKLQSDVDPANIARTRCYLARGLLRASRLEAAEKEIKNLRELNPSGFSRTELKFLEADLERRKGHIWEDADFENDADTHGGHPLGFYFQSTARQPGRPSSESIQRFRLAAIEFKKDVGEFSERNILELFSLFVLWRTAVLERNPKNALEQKELIDEFLCHSDACSMQAYYSNLICQADRSGDFEPLFNSVPYF